MQLHELMSPPGKTFFAEDSLADVVAYLAAHPDLPAVVCDDGKPTGVITPSGLAELLTRSSHGIDLTSMTAGQAMVSPLLAVPVNLAPAELVRLAAEQPQQQALVLDVYGLLLGSISHRRLLAAGLQQQPGQEPAGGHWLSLEDSLTGLGNRRAMESDLRQIEAMAKRRKEPFAIAVIDVDWLSRFNQSHGRNAGDRVLELIAATLRQCIRASDKAFRSGGEEFVYIMPGTPLAGAMIAANRVRAAIQQAAAANPDLGTAGITVSIGVAAREAGSWQELLKLAEDSLQQAKSEGRNRTTSTQLAAAE